MNKYTKLLSNTFIFACGIGISKVIVALMLPLYTRTLSNAELGNAELVINFTKLAIPICSLSIASAVIRFGLSKEQSLDDLIKNSTVFMGGSTLFLFIISLILYNTEKYGCFSTYFFFISVLTMYHLLFSLYVKASDNTILYSVDIIINNIVLAGLNIYFLAYAKAGLSGYFVSIIASEFCSIVFLLLAGRILNSYRKGSFNIKLIKCMLIYSFPLVIADVSWAIISLTDRIMITDRISDSKNGIYSAAAKIPMLLTVISDIFASAWSISTIQEGNKKDSNIFFENVFNFLHIFMCFVILTLFALNNNIIRLIFGFDFSESILYIPVLLIGTLFTCYSGYFSCLFSLLKKTKHIMISTVIGVLTNVALNIVLISRMGIYGACIATVVSSAAIFIYRFLVYGIYNSLDLSIYRFALSLFLLIISMLSSMLDVYSILVPCLSLAIIFVVYRDKISSMVLSIRTLVERKIR